MTDKKILTPEQVQEIQERADSPELPKTEPLIIGRNDGTGWWLEKHSDKLVLRGPYSQRDEYPLSYEAALMHGMIPVK